LRRTEPKGSGLRFGLFGTGYWARETHAAALAAHADAELVGVWGRHADRTRAVADGFGARAFEDIDELISAVDAVAVALPPDVQADIAIRAASTGRHLLLEKPLAFSSDMAERVADAVERNNVRALVFHTAHFTPQVEDWLAGVRALGGWHGGGVTLLASIFKPGNPFGESAWRRERGALWDVGPHALDMVLTTLGPVEDMLAGAGRGDTVHLLLRHVGGASSILTLSLTAPEAAVTSACWVYGAQGVSIRPEGPTSPAQAFGNAISALTAEGPNGWPGHTSDVLRGRDIVRIIETAEQYLRSDQRGAYFPAFP
jgi:predicted dehydrogenase